MKLYDRKHLQRTIALLIGLLVLVCWYTSLPTEVNVPEQADPQTLYHTVWQVTGRSFYDTQKLEGWKSWEHKFDGKLKTQEDAEKAIDQMLESLGDRYTHFLAPKATKAEGEQRQGYFVGIGAVF